MSDYRECPNGGKKCFDTKAAAQHSARSMMNVHKSRRLHVYYCKNCRSYHITSASE